MVALSAVPGWSRSKMLCTKARSMGRRLSRQRRAMQEENRAGRRGGRVLAQEKDFAVAFACQVFSPVNRVWIVLRKKMLSPPYSTVIVQESAGFYRRSSMNEDIEALD